jgi:hypothetical protein
MCLSQPPIIRGIGILAHEGVLDVAFASENLIMHLALIVVPDHKLCYN